MKNAGPSTEDYEVNGRSLANTIRHGRMAVNRPGLISAAVVLVIAAACSSGAGTGNGRTLTVFAASSLTEAFRAVAASFEAAHPGTSVALNFDGSQRLRLQLEHGAGADVYASADPHQMNEAKTLGLVLGEPVDFATNTMAVIASTRDDKDSGGLGGDLSPRDSHTGVRTPADLGNQGVKLALAQPAVPAGRYSRTVISNLGQGAGFGPRFPERVLANVVSLEPNVRSVLQKVALGEVDAGIVYVTDARVASDVRIIPLPAWANVVAAYPAAVLRDGPQRPAAEAFVRFLTSHEGRSILESQGFGPAQPGPGSRPGPDTAKDQRPGAAPRAAGPMEIRGRPGGAPRWP